MATHSDIVGGSTAGRLITCPGSYRLIQSIPDLTDKPSYYAAEGTVLHDLMADILTNRGKVDDVAGEYEEDGFVIDVTPELVRDALQPCIDFLGDQVRAVRIFHVEQSLAFPGIEGVFGTCDLIAFTRDNRVVIVDWKFGKGVQVLAEYPDGAYNSQLAFYACAARAAYPKEFEGKVVEAYIVQPRSQRASDEPVWSRTYFSPADLDEFEALLQEVVEQALGDDAPLQESKHCRFCPARPVCPEFAKPLFDADFGEVLAPSRTDGPEWPNVLQAALDLVPRLEQFAAEARRQAQLYLEGGGEIEGWKLVPKRATRKWINEALAEMKLKDLGLDYEDSHKTTVISPAQAEKALKPLGKKIPDGFVIAESSGNTLAPASDRRPDASPSALMEEYAELLEDFNN